MIDVWMIIPSPLNLVLQLSARLNNTPSSPLLSLLIDSEPATFLSLLLIPLPLKWKTRIVITYHCHLLLYQILITSKSYTESILRYRVQVPNPTFRRGKKKSRHSQLSKLKLTNFVSIVPSIELSITKSSAIIYPDQVNQNLPDYCEIDL